MTVPPESAHHGGMQGRELLATLSTLRATRAAAVLRHAARHPIVDPRAPLAAELTEAGHRDAEAFGASLQGFDRVRLFHSPVKRCQQTAEGVAAGAVRAGLQVELVGARPELGVAYILDQVETGRLSGLHGEHFVRLWFTGQVADNLILPPAGIARHKLSFLREKLAEPVASGRRLDLHNSHDWNVIILRQLLLGVSH